MRTIICLGSGSEATLSAEYQKAVTAGKAEKRTSPALLIIHDGQKILFDAGPNISSQLEKANTHPDFFFVTHMHPDHSSRIDDLPDDTKKYVNMQHYEKLRLQDGNTSVMAFPVKHSIVCPAVGFKFFSDHLRIVYIPDYLEIIDEKKVLPDTNLAILDGSVLKKDIIRHKDLKIGHRSIANSILMCRQFGIKSMIFTHIGKHGADHDKLVKQVAELTADNETIFVARDGMEFELTSGGLKLIEELQLEAPPFPFPDIEESVLPADFIKQVTPEYLEALEDEAILSLHLDLHDSLVNGKADETLVNAHLYILTELENRDIEHEWIGDDLDLESKHLFEEADPLQTSLDRLVPFIVTEGAVCLCGSSIYGLKNHPHDLDVLVRSTEDAAAARDALQSLWPDRSVQIIPEVKGPNWDYIPIGDFIAVPSRFAEAKDMPQEISFGEDIPDQVKDLLKKLGHFMVRKDYLKLVYEDSKLVIIRNDKEPDAGTILKLLRLFPEAMIISGDIEPGTGHADLAFSPYRHFEKRVLNEPLFRPYYNVKTVDTTA